MRINKKDYHRNGITGNGFDIITFNEGKKQMVAILFEEKGNCAVFDRNLLGKGIIAFGENSFRAEYYEDDLRQAIKSS